MSFMSTAPRPQTQASSAVVVDLARERVDLPVGRVGGNHIEVAVEEQGGPSVLAR